jgi:hypothetical protein
MFAGQAGVPAVHGKGTAGARIPGLCDVPLSISARASQQWLSLTSDILKEPAS